MATAPTTPAARQCAMAQLARHGLVTPNPPRDPLASGWELIAVDAADSAALRALAARTRMLATTVGPFIAYGMEVARACAEEGTPLRRSHR